jgi:hypothetical protein
MKLYSLSGRMIWLHKVRSTPGALPDKKKLNIPVILKNESQGFESLQGGLKNIR